MSLPNKRSFDGETSDVALGDPCPDDDEGVLGESVKCDDWVNVTPKIGLLQNFTDCSNVFKAFIGSALIGLPFATLQAGVYLALAGVFIIGIATDHCCGLIVKCKQMVIANVIEERVAQGVDQRAIAAEEDMLGRTLSFGRIGKACMGRVGLLAVNISVMFTQFGFTIGYFIFLGNTLRAIIKHFVVKTGDFHNVTAPFNTTVVPLTTKLIMTTTPNSSFISSTLATNPFFTATNGSTILHYLHHHMIKAIKEPLSAHNLLLNSSSTFVVLLLLPLPLLVGIAFIRNLRKLGPISVIANVSITGAFAATAIYVLSSVKHLPTPFRTVRFATFPIFFGQVTGAFEGIGTVIPIEGSMAENRPRYPCFLHISLFILALILGTFGIVGYIAFGEHTCQIVTSNLHGWMAVVLQSLLFVGVLFTYPLQLYPCIQITESAFLKLRRWRVSRNRKYNLLRSPTPTNIDEADCLIESDEKPPEVEVIKLKTWEGNVIRAMLVIITACIALAFRSQFAYIAALTGSVGSSLLSYILPPLFHISLTGHKRKQWVLVKDVFLILFGIVGGTMGLVVTLKEIVESFGKGHPAHC